MNVPQEVCIKRSRKLMLPLDIQIQLFDKMIGPILLYGCEVWCYQMNDLATKLQLRYFKFLLGANKATPTNMVLGELGQYPLDIAAKTRMLGFWYKLVHPDNSHKWSSVMYKFMLQLYINNIYASPYITTIKHVLDRLGYGNFWLSQGNIDLSYSSFKFKMKQRLQDQFVQSWQADINTSELYYNYRMF